MSKTYKEGVKVKRGHLDPWTGITRVSQTNRETKRKRVINFQQKTFDQRQIKIRIDRLRKYSF